jgi:hypothetical protein
VFFFFVVLRVNLFDTDDFKYYGDDDCLVTGCNERQSVKNTIDRRIHSMVIGPLNYSYYKKNI